MIVPRELQQLTPRARQSPPQTAESPALPALARRWPRVLLVVVASVLLLGAGVALGLARYGGSYAASRLDLDASSPDLSKVRLTPAEWADRLEKRVASYGPGSETYIVVDTHNNKLRVYRRGQMVREAICSTGSGVRLRDPRNGKEWIFDTPQGELKVLRKVKNPVWVKPDWAFIEEGFEPPKSMRARVDDFSLGDYGLYMRDGYIIHGTIFKTLLGRRVTHGCIRLGDEDLKFVFDSVPAGSRVFLY